MKTLLCSALVGFLLSTAGFAATPAPSGRVVELHACELYTGGCTASAQSTLGGRSLLRVWSFENGAQDGVELRGLQVAALQMAEQNLAFRDTKPTTAVVYLPAQASEAQRDALLSWLKQTNAEFAAAPLVQKVANITWTQEEEVGRVSAKIGDGITLQTRAVDHCSIGGCGEALWYSPRTKTGSFTVLVGENSSVREPAVALVWKQSGANTVFLGRFGGSENSEPTFNLASVD